MLSQTEYSKNTNRSYSTSSLTDNNKPSTLSCVYQVTLDSQSALGIFSSQGKAIITQLSEHRYEIKAVLYPINPPIYAITTPYYIHAIATETTDEQTLLCSGQAYVTKGFFSKVIDGDQVSIKLTEKLSSKTNTYDFSLNPFTLWGASPGKITNTGTLICISDVTDEESLKETAYCDNLKIR